MPSRRLVRYGPHAATERQWQVLEQFCSYHQTHGCAPTAQALADRLHCTRQAIGAVLQSLRARGLVTWEQGRDATARPCVQVAALPGGRAVFWGNG